MAAGEKATLDVVPGLYDEVMRGVGILLPESCPLCERLCRGGVCRTCLDALPRLYPRCCERCGAPGKHSRACRECAGRCLAFDAARQAVSFEGPMRRLIHLHKYQARYGLSVALGSLTAEAANGFSVQAVAWVAPTKQRVRERGFDHARALAQVVAARVGAPLLDALARTGHPRAQVGLAHEMRASNVAGSFMLRLPPPPDVLLVDDVYTTGATLSEAALVLRRGGARRVFCVSVARALPTARTDYRDANVEVS